MNYRLCSWPIGLQDRRHGQCYHLQRRGQHHRNVWNHDVFTKWNLSCTNSALLRMHLSRHYKAKDFNCNFIYKETNKVGTAVSCLVWADRKKSSDRNSQLANSCLVFIWLLKLSLTQEKEFFVSKNMVWVTLCISISVALNHFSPALPCFPEGQQPLK